MPPCPPTYPSAHPLPDSPLTRRTALRLAAGAALLPALPREVRAMFAGMTEIQLVAASDAIVIGALAEPSRRTPEGRPYAMITAETVLKGDPTLTALPLALVPSDRPRSSSDVTHSPGASGLWFLRRLPGDPPLYAADHPQRFVPAADAGPVLARVRRLLEG